MWRIAGYEGLELKRAKFSSFKFGRHFYLQYVISMPRGSVQFKISGTHHHVPANHLVLLNPDDVHEMWTDKNKLWGFNCFYIEESLM